MAPDLGRSGRSAAFDLALGTIERTVRSDDRVCPFGISHIAVAFGPDADAVTPRTLGERLARAVGQGMISARPERDMVGQGRPGPRSMAVGTVPSTTIVTVDRMLEDPVARLRSGARGEGPVLRHRTRVRYSTARLAGYGTRHDDRVPGSDPGQLIGTVLVVDPDLRPSGTPGLAAQAACSLASRLGYRAGVLALSTDDKLVADIDGSPLDLVVLMVGAEPAGHCSWSASTWCVPAQLTGVYRSMGIEVLAVSSGATAGAMVGCIEQGASVLFDLNALPTELMSMRQSKPSGRPRAQARSPHDVPAPLRDLLKLTSSERRVLFYLTTGLGAQEIAEDLVVSLATVRSHIRSILRKLDVRSQLAAVAVANSCGAAGDRSSHAS